MLLFQLFEENHWRIRYLREKLLEFLVLSKININNIDDTINKIRFINFDLLLFHLKFPLFLFHKKLFTINGKIVIIIISLIR